ncbi:MAG TPA: glycoside hydrolase family 3 N-terminal domain-containing protein [Egibacteraceae bacterium]|nr:glycoside hydrolase family 3 N-terminal domain-containing protein [Egibacteraceae bacterium]
MRPRAIRLAGTLLAVLMALTVGVPAAAQSARRPPHAGGGAAGPPVHAEQGLLRSTVARMSLEELVGQLFTTHVYGAHAQDTSRAADNQAKYGVSTPAEVVRKYHLGGVIYFAWSGNTQDPAQIRGLSTSLQDVAGAQPSRVPLHVAIDQETGIVARMLEPATVFPGAMALGATRDADLAARVFAITARELDAVGVTMNFAPVLDVNTNPQNPVIGVRSFGEEPGLVGGLGTATMAALQAGGVSATIKHFPGHGDTDVDSHYGLPSVEYDRETLMNVHVAPFAQAINAGADAVMTAHMIVRAVDPDLPATLSRRVLTGLLREELGFDGLIVTDALEMGALANFWDSAEIAVMALQAGADVLLMPADMDLAYRGVLDAVRSGQISRRRIEESVMRILRAKYARGLFHNPYPEHPLDVVGSPAHQAVAVEAGERATTLVANDAGLLPLDAAEVASVLVTGWGAATTATLGSLVAAHGPEVTVRETGANPRQETIAGVLAEAQRHDVVVVATMSAAFAPAVGQRQLVEALHAADTPVVVIAVRNPYDIASFPQVDTYLATYSWRPVSLRGAVAVVFGAVAPTGRLPVTIPTADFTGVLYPFGHGLGF